MGNQWTRRKRMGKKTARRVFDPSVLDAFAWARHDGGRGEGRPRNCPRLPNDADLLEAEHHRLDEIRALLHAACGGCEQTLTFLLKIGGEAASCRDVSRELGKNPGQVWRRVQQLYRRIANTIELARMACSSIARGEEGFTLHPSRRFVVGVDAWAVSLDGLGACHPAPPSLVEVTRFIADRYELLFGRAWNHLGGWHDKETGNYWLDVSRLIRLKAVAMTFARTQNQKAITHLQSLTTLTVSVNPQERRRRAA